MTPPPFPTRPHQRSVLTPDPDFLSKQAVKSPFNDPKYVRKLRRHDFRITSPSGAASVCGDSDTIHQMDPPYTFFCVND